MRTLNVLVVGAGGREHAFLWKLAQSKRIGKLYAAPGNGGTRKIAENVPIKTGDIHRLASFAEAQEVDLTVVGPELPLERGIVDEFVRRGLRIFGPSRAAAEIELSKAFAKNLMRKVGIPTAPFRVFGRGELEYDKALAYLMGRGTPIVVKASGSAEGKGSYVCHNFTKAQLALKKIMLEWTHGEAGNEVIVEDCLEGREVSFQAICDGKDFLMLLPSQDHKTIGEGDTGDNTGGMGAVAPLPWVTAEMIEEVADRIIRPVLEELAKLGRPFGGCLYPGIMWTNDGPMVLEFNARFGDPEAQVLMRLLKTDLLDILGACVEGKLSDIAIEWHAGFATCFVVASGGYPGRYRPGWPVRGLPIAEAVPGVVVFHAGTKIDGHGLFRTAGGRVLGVSTVGSTLPEILERGKEASRMIRFKGAYYRRDIGEKLL